MKNGVTVYFRKKDLTEFLIELLEEHKKVSRRRLNRYLQMDLPETMINNKAKEIMKTEVLLVRFRKELKELEEQDDQKIQKDVKIRIKNYSYADKT